MGSGPAGAAQGELKSQPGRRRPHPGRIAKRITHTYNADGQRVQRDGGPGAARYQWDGQNVHLKLNTSNNLIDNYPYEPSEYGKLISSSTLWHLYDPLASTAVLTTSAPTTSDIYTYGAWGELDTPDVLNTAVDPFLFVGREGYYSDDEGIDKNTTSPNLPYYVRARFYNPLCLHRPPKESLALIGTKERDMQFAALALLLCIVADDQSQTDEIISRHRDFAVSKLKDGDPIVASAALDALATLDCDGYVELLRDKLHLPITDPSLEVALRHLIKRATPNDLARAKAIVAEATTKGAEERKADPFLVDAANIEFLALEVLLASRNPQAVRFATGYLEETIARNPGPGVAQMDLALELIGRYAVKSAATQVRADAREELQFAALSALAKNGQQAALDTLKKRYEPEQPLEPYMMSDHQLIAKLGLTVEQLRAIHRTGSSLMQIIVAGQLAKLGETRELRAAAEAVVEKPNAEFTGDLVSMAGQYGDESFISDLDAIASKESALGKLWAARAIFQIAHRSKMR